MTRCVTAAVFALLFLISSGAHLFAAHPLITDDTYTQGRGNSQVEVSGEYVNSVDTDAGATVNTVSANVVYTYGIVDTLDVILAGGYQDIRNNTEGVLSRNAGVTDSSFDLKWRFYEKKDAFSLALKPGVVFSTGNEARGLGSGRERYRLFLLSSIELDPFAVHVNLGYIRNENRLDERTDLLHASIAGEFRATKKLRLVANTGIETSKDRSHAEDPAFILFGIIYGITKDLDVDLGIRHRITDVGDTVSVSGGVTFRF